MRRGRRESVVHAPVRAFRNPEYRCCSAAYIFMPRLSAIIQRSCDVLVHVQVSVPSLCFLLSTLLFSLSFFFSLFIFSFLS